MSTASRPPRRFAVAVATVASAALLLAGCSGENAPDDPAPSQDGATTATPSDEPSVSSDPTPSAEPTTATAEPPDSESELPDDDPTTDVPFPADLKPDTGSASDDARLRPTGFRVGVHYDFDRVVIDFSGPGTPGWRAQYTDAPTAQGAGPPVDLQGQAGMSLEIDGFTLPPEDGSQSWEGPENLTPLATGTVLQVYRGPLFEGVQEVSLGLTSEEPFRVYALEDPTRLVVDVYHPDLPSDEKALPDPRPNTEMNFPANSQPDTQSATGGAQLSPVDLRFGVQDRFDRIVLDLVGTGAPGWRGEYVTDPMLAGSGAPINTTGKADLQVSVSGVVYPIEPSAEPYEGPQRFRPKTGGNIQEVVYGGIFEGQLEIFIGLKAETPFRVYQLHDPTRVVIDVQHP